MGQYKAFLKVAFGRIKVATLAKKTEKQCSEMLYTAPNMYLNVRAFFWIGCNLLNEAPSIEPRTYKAINELK